MFHVSVNDFRQSDTVILHTTHYQDCLMAALLWMLASCIRIIPVNSQFCCIAIIEVKPAMIKEFASV